MEQLRTSVRLQIETLVEVLHGRRVGVLQGGNSPEREASLYTAKHIHQALDRSDIPNVAIDPLTTQDIATAIQDVDVVYNALHGGAGENGVIQGFLEFLSKPYTGASVLSSAIAFHKPLFKNTLKAEGVRVPTSLTLDQCRAALARNRSVIIKPVDGGGSLGIRLVSNKDQLPTSLSETHSGYKKFFAEEYIDGRNITVSILEIAGSPLLLPPVEIVLPDDKLFYDTDSKYGESAELNAKPNLPQSVRDQLSAVSLRSFQGIECRDYARLDFLVNDREVFLLELNTLPGLYPGSNFCTAATDFGFEFYETVLLILAGAVRRSAFGKDLP